MIHRESINSNVVLTWSASLSSISRRLDTADLIAQFSERRIKDSAFEQHTAIGIGDRRSTVVSQCRNNNVRSSMSATAREINVLEIDWTKNYVPFPLSIFYSHVAAFTKEPTQSDKFMNCHGAMVAVRLNQIIILIRVIVSLLIYVGLISHKCPAP